ncbi:MAG: hypothetical protein LCH61_16845 [Proteobacteria bacterium]|nr:hypothetical protein [Pseudomonadota bacterium]
MMIFLKAFFGDLGLRGWLAMIFGVLLVLLVWQWRAALIEAGGARVIDRITNANKASEAKADAAEQKYRACVASGKEPMQCVE